MTELLLNLMNNRFSFCLRQSQVGSGFQKATSPPLFYKMSNILVVSWYALNANEGKLFILIILQCTLLEREREINGHDK